VVQIWSRGGHVPLTIEGNEPRVLHRVAEGGCPESTISHGNFVLFKSPRSILGVGFELCTSYVGAKRDHTTLNTTNSSSSLLLSSLELSDTEVYAPYIRARLGTAAHFCEVVVPKLRTDTTSYRVLI